MMERRSRTDDRSGALSLAAPRADSLGPGALNKARARNGDQQTMKLWGGNYSSDPDAAFWEFNRSFPFDRRLPAQGIPAFPASTPALRRCPAIPNADAPALDLVLAPILTKAPAHTAH